MIKVNTYNTREKVYIQNAKTGQYLARFCRISIEFFDIKNESMLYCYIIKDMKPTIKDWELFKSKAKEIYNIKLDDKLFKDTIMNNNE